MKDEHRLPRAFVFMGVSGCGKTTLGTLWAQEIGLEFFDGDDFHPRENIEKMTSGIPLQDSDREGWLNRLNALVRGSLDRGGCVLACSALKESYRNRLGNGLDRRITFIYLKGSRECIKIRLEQRTGHYMPATLLESQFDALEEPVDSVVLDISETPEAMLVRLRQHFCTH